MGCLQASKFYVVFEQDITYWEKTLSHISETIEIISQVRHSLFRGACCSFSRSGGGHAYQRVCPVGGPQVF
jgi:hypothetical protein